MIKGELKRENLLINTGKLERAGLMQYEEEKA